MSAAPERIRLSNLIRALQTQRIKNGTATVIDYTWLNKFIKDKFPHILNHRSQTPDSVTDAASTDYLSDSSEPEKARSKDIATELGVLETKTKAELIEIVYSLQDESLKLDAEKNEAEDDASSLQVALNTALLENKGTKNLYLQEKKNNAKLQQEILDLQMQIKIEQEENERMFNNLIKLQLMYQHIHQRMILIGF
jgi:hypothetical protein